MLCPQPPLVTEHGRHRRLGKRDSGICEAHRGRAVRAQKKLRALGLGERTRVFGRRVADGAAEECFETPAVRARIVSKGDGRPVHMDQLQSIQSTFEDQLPQYLERFLEKHGLKLGAIRWTGSHPGSVIVDFCISFVKDSGDTSTSNESLINAFSAWIMEQTKETISKGFPAFVISELVC